MIFAVRGSAVPAYSRSYSGRMKSNVRDGQTEPRRLCPGLGYMGKTAVRKVRLLPALSTAASQKLNCIAASGCGITWAVGSAGPSRAFAQKVLAPEEKVRLVVPSLAQSSHGSSTQKARPANLGHRIPEPISVSSGHFVQP